MAVVLIIAFAIMAVTLFGIHQKYTNGFCKSKKRLHGKTCIVTGGTNGMGLEIAKEYARRGARVIVACPFEDEGVNAQDLITHETGNDKVTFKHLNLASLDSTRKFAEDILRTEDRLDLLINNAGINDKNALTSDGLNFMMQVNYYGHFLLTNLLLPLMKKTGTPTDKARIVNTSSICHLIGRFECDIMNKVDQWNLAELYANSKFCLLLFSRELTKRLKGHNVVVNSVDPGAVGTTIYLNSFGIFIGSIIENFFKVFCKTPWEGCQTALHVSLDEGLNDVSGEFFRNCEQVRAKAASYDDQAAGELWKESMQLVKLKETEVDDYNSNIVKSILNTNKL